VHPLKGMFYENLGITEEAEVALEGRGKRKKKKKKKRMKVK
jgi:hypothetical protein